MLESERLQVHGELPHLRRNNPGYKPRVPRASYLWINRPWGAQDAAAAALALTRALKEWFYQLDPADADMVTPDRLGVLAWLRSLLGDDPC